MAAIGKTSVSAGLIIRKMLTEDAAVSKLAGKVYPIFNDKATLPYVVYRCTSMEQNPVKNCAGSDTVQVEVVCYAAKYDGSLELAEAVRGALDNHRGESDGLTMRSCLLTDRSEGWSGDAYAQVMTFKVKI